MDLFAGLVLLVAAVGLVTQVATIIELLAERKETGRLEISSRDVRSRSRTLTVTLVAATAISPAVGFIASVAASFWDHDLNIGFSILLIATIVLGGAGLLAVKQLAEANKDDYWDYAVLEHDLKEMEESRRLRDGSEELPAERSQFFHKVQARLRKAADLDLNWTKAGPHKERWLEATTTSQSLQTTRRDTISQIARKIRERDSLTYLRRNGLFRLVYALGAVLSAGYLLLTPTDLTHTITWPAVIAVAVTLTVIGIIWLVPVFILVRLEVISRLALTYLRRELYSECTQMLARLDMPTLKSELRPQPSWGLHVRFFGRNSR